MGWGEDMLIRTVETVVAAAVAALLVAFAVELWRGPRPTFEESITVTAPSGPVARK